MKKYVSRRSNDIPQEGKRERVIHSKDHQEHDFVYYVFQQDLRDKFTKILGGVTPDFALTPKAKIEKGGKRMDNNGRYILFQMDKEGKPKVVKTLDNKWRRKRGKTGQEWLWDTPEIGGLFYKKPLTPPPK